MGLVFSLSVDGVAAQPTTNKKQNAINIFFIRYLIRIITQKPIDATIKIPYNKYRQITTRSDDTTIEFSICDIPRRF